MQNNKDTNTKNTNNKKDISKVELSKIICDCHQVSLGEIIYVIEQQGASSLEDIAKICDAGSGCGSCVRAEDDIKVKKHDIYLVDIAKKFKKQQ